MSGLLCRLPNTRIQLRPNSGDWMTYGGDDGGYSGDSGTDRDGSGGDGDR